MSLAEIIPNKSIDKSLWNVFVSKNAGLVYHTWEWIAVLSESYTRMENVSIASSDGGIVTGIFPMISLNAYGLSYSLSLPSSSGGPVFQKSEDLNSALKHYLKSSNVVEIHTYSKLEIEGESSVPHLLLPLSRDIDEIRSGYEKNVRNALKKAERNGVKIRASSDDADIRDFYQIYEETVLTQAGPSRISLTHIENVIKKLAEGTSLFLVAEIDHKIVGGLVGLFNDRNAFYWAAASSRGYNSSELLLDSLIEHSAGRADFLYLGGGRFGLKDSLYFFKSRWGAKEISAYRYHLVSGIKGKALTALTGIASHFPQVKEKMFESR